MQLSSRPLPGGESAVHVLKTMGLWGSEAVLHTMASNEPAVQVLKTTGLLVGGQRLSSIPLPRASLLFRSSKPWDVWVARRSSIPRPCDEPAVRVLETTGLPVGGKRLS